MFEFTIKNSRVSKTIYDAFNQLTYYLSNDKRIAAIIGPLQAGESFTPTEEPDINPDGN